MSKIEHHNVPQAWVPTKDVLRKTRKFLAKFEYHKAEIQEKQERVDELSKHYRYGVMFSRSWIWRMEREVTELNMLAEMSIDGRILVSVNDTNLLSRANPQAVEDAIRDLDKNIKHKLERRAEDEADAIVEEQRALVREDYRRRGWRIVGLVAMAFSAALVISFFWWLA